MTRFERKTKHARASIHIENIAHENTYPKDSRDSFEDDEVSAQLDRLHFLTRERTLREGLSKCIHQTNGNKQSTLIYLVEDCHCLDACHRLLELLDWRVSMRTYSLLLELYQCSSCIGYVCFQTNYSPKEDTRYTRSSSNRKDVHYVLVKH
jgi:hypothetical protein